MSAYTDIDKGCHVHLFLNHYGGQKNRTGSLVVIFLLCHPSCCRSLLLMQSYCVICKTKKHILNRFLQKLGT